MQIIKNIISLSLLIFFSLGQAQYLIEDNDATENSTELGKTLIHFNFEKPLEHYRIKCENPTYALFPNGEKKFRDELFKKLKFYLDSDTYFVNGNFFINFTIDKNGKAKDIHLSPKIDNSDMLRKDVEFAIKKIKTKWTPATCNGTPINSNMRLKIEFSEIGYDL